MTEKTLEVKIYNELIKSMQLKAVDLVKLNVEKYNSFPEGSEVSVEMNFSVEGYEKTVDELHIIPKLKVTMVNEQEKVPVAEIQCSYFVVYTSDKLGSVEEVYLEMFIGKTIQHAVWPYLRELVASLTSRMGYSAFVMPVFVRE